MDDVRRYIDVARLVEMWKDMWLSPHVRERWRRWLRDRDLIASPGAAGPRKRLVLERFVVVLSPDVPWSGAS